MTPATEPMGAPTLSEETPRDSSLEVLAQQIKDDLKYSDACGTSTGRLCDAATC